MKTASIGLFSEIAAKKYGTIFYRTADDKEVEVTSVCGEGQEESYKWPDAVVVSRCLTVSSRCGRPDKSRVLDTYLRSGSALRAWMAR